MGRGSGKAQWQTVEVLAAFKGGEAACDRAQTSLRTDRASKSSVEYANHLRLMVADERMQQEGITFLARTVGKDKVKWDVEASIMGRSGQDILKKHKQIIAHARKHIMPGYHAFFTKLGKPPSGTMIDDCHHEVLKFHWDSLEEERLLKLSKKGVKEEGKDAEEVAPAEAMPVPHSTEKENTVHPVPVPDVQAQACPASTAAAGLLVSFGSSLANMGGFFSSSSSTSGSAAEQGNPSDPAAAEDEDDDAAEPSDKSMTKKEMPEGWKGNAYHVVWCKYGPLAPADDHSASLSGPGETEGKPRSATSRASQKQNIKQERHGEDGGSAPSKRLNLGGGSSPEDGGMEKKFLKSVEEMEKFRLCFEASNEVEQLQLILKYTTDPDERKQVEQELLKLARQNLAESRKKKSAEHED